MAWEMGDSPSMSGYTVSDLARGSAVDTDLNTIDVFIANFRRALWLVSATIIVANILFFCAGMYVVTKLRSIAGSAEASPTPSRPVSRLRRASESLLGFVVVQFIFSLPVVISLVWKCVSDGFLKAQDDALGEFAFDACAQGCELVVATAQVLQCARQAHQMGCLLYTSPSPRDAHES
eukprot:159573-Prymnesium_polylepis.1